MPKKAVINPNNPLYLARLEASKYNPVLANRNRAAAVACISEERMERIETGQSMPRPDEMEAIVRTYQLPRLKQRYCNDGCPFRMNGFGEIEKSRASG